MIGYKLLREHLSTLRYVYISYLLLECYHYLTALIAAVYCIIVWHSLV